MSFDDTSEMVKRILEQDDVPREFCQLVYEKTRGNPFFAEEVIKSLKEEEVIYLEDNKWKIKDVSKIEFPKTVKSVIKARISRLDDECQNVLTLASFVGNDFTLEAMCAVTGIEKNTLLKLMDKLFKTGLIKERVIRGEGICSFADILVRDVVYEEVSPLTRKELHGVVGCALEKVYATKLDEHFGELAYHFLEGGNKEKALDYFLKAGEKATKVYANNEAASYFKSALTLLEEKEGVAQERARILENLGDIERLIGKYNECIKCWTNALLLQRGLPEKTNIARLHRKMASVLWDKLGNREKAKEHHQEALKILEAAPESVELASLYEDMAGMVAMGATGDMAQALSLSEKAIDLAQKLNAYDITAHSCMWAAEISSWLGNGKRAQEYCERALKIALDNDCLETAAWAYDDLASFHLDVDRKERFEFREKGFELAKKVGSIEFISLIGLKLAQNYAGMGDTSKAVSMADDSVSLNRKVGNMVQLNWSLVWSGVFYETLGETEKSAQCFNEAVSISERLDDFQSVLGAHIGLGWFYYRRGEYVKAKGLMEKGYETAEKHGVKGIQYSQWIIRNFVELGEIERAKSLIDSLQEFAHEGGRKTLTAYAHALRGTLLRAQKKWKKSIENFEKSIQEFDALGARQWNMYDFADFVLWECARMYLERNQEGDRERAQNLLNQALEIFEKIGAKKDIEKVEARIAFIETGREALKPKPLALVSTGYADLDKLLYGGIPSNHAVVLTSPSCDERDWLIKSFLEAGAKKGEVAFYVTINPGSAKTLVDEFKSSFWLFVCNPQADAIVKDAPNVVKLKGVENLTDISIALTSTIRKLDPSLKGPRRICLGLVSDVLLQHHAVQTRRWLAGLIPELQAEEFTTLALIDPQVHPSEELHAILGLFEGEINIFEKETEKGLERYLKIKKMSNHKYLENELPLKREQP
jgi:tetratricopeptide (TPR) repeat protein/KaiC/GvpD/RAD55 family RecA-like ATPase